MDGVAAPGVAASYSRGDHVHPTDTSRAPLNAPVFTGDARAVTPAAFDNDTSIATTAFVTAAIDGAAPIGVAYPYMGKVADIPANYVVCDGANKSRATYPKLAAWAAAIGYLWGSGDGSTTFGVPDLRGRVLAGVDAGLARLSFSGDVGPSFAGGVEVHTIATTDTYPHVHTVGAGAYNQFRTAINTAQVVTLSGSVAIGASLMDNTPASGANWNQVQPTIITCYIMRGK
jgi:microcystin-dependent protein